MAPSKDEQFLVRLQNFTTRHTSHHRPIALITSGGTAADLEVNAVRFLDNFSTGLRGACAVEQFLHRGYAVIHLKRVGSVSPFGRHIEDAVGERGRMGFESIGKLFECGTTHNVDLDCDTLDLVSDELASHQRNNATNSPADPWLYSNQHSDANNLEFNDNHPESASPSTYGLSLNPRLQNSHVLISTVRTYNSIMQQGLLITLYFRTVDDYLQKLETCCEAINTAGSLGLVYLAAAVSDFYIPLEKRAVHKIQSRDYGLATSDSINTAQIGVDNTLTITLYPVPKVIPELRKTWCPHAFVVSFKLETDSNILHQKAAMAMKRNGVHLVVGNELKTRYEKVFILSHSKVHKAINGTYEDASGNETSDEFNMTQVTSSDSKSNSLEDATVEFVVRHHFYYISTQLDVSRPNVSSVELLAHTTSEAEEQHQSRLEGTYRQLQRQKLKSRMFELVWNVAGSAAGMIISFGIARMMQQRQQMS